MNVRKEMIRFLFAGIIVTATDFSLYYFLFHFMPFSVSKGISFTCAGIVGYLFNKYWIFNCNHPSCTEIGRYILVNTLALGVNVLTNQVILIMRPGSVLLAFIIALMLTGFLTFICFKWWVFRALLK